MISSNRFDFAPVASIRPMPTLWLGTTSQPRSPQVSYLPLLIMGTGVIVAVGLYWWRKQRHRLQRSVSGQTPSINWHQAEFECGPLVFDPPSTPTAEFDKVDSIPSSFPVQFDGSANDRSTFPGSEEEPAAMQDPAAMSLSDRYFTFIDQLITDTLKGNIRSQEQVYDRLAAQFQPGSGEIFERCLAERVDPLQHRRQVETDELKLAKVDRQLRALRTLQEVWKRYQQTQQTQSLCHDAVVQLMQADARDRLLVLLQILDPNQTYVFNRQQIELLAKALNQVQASDADDATVAELHRLATGLKQGLSTYTAIEPHLVSWLYENPQAYVGFAAGAGINNPWNSWGKSINRPLPQLLFAGQAQNQSAAFLAQSQSTVDLSAWIELAVLLRGMQSGLVVWFDKQPYSFQAGRDLAAATFVAFAIVWCELSSGFQQALQLSEFDRQRLSRACFQIALQILRAFAQRDNFPLYGGVFASFSGAGFRDTIAYLDQPLKAIEKTQEKARILTLLGYSQQWLGSREQAYRLHTEALDLARQVSDQTCEIANLNHLSRLSLSQRKLTDAINYGQRALLLARQLGDAQGETNAIANLGYAEVRQAQQQEHVTDLDLESCIQRLERGLKLAEKHNDLLSQVFCGLGLGSAHLTLNQPSTAKPYLEKSLNLSVQIGNLELEGLSYAAIAEASYQLNQFSQAIIHAYLGMYLLEQKQMLEKQQAENLVTILQGRLGREAVREILQQQRSLIIARIGVDGFDHLLSLV
jgi:tetratricopeptide (TPR) repeat protein